MNWKQIVDAQEKINGITYPNGLIVNNINFNHKSIERSNFSFVKGLKWEQIKNAKNLNFAYIKYPADFDIEKADFSGGWVQGSDFSLVRGLKWEQLKDSVDLSGIKYPIDFDIKTANFDDKWLGGSDFSLVRGLKWKNIKKAKLNIAVQLKPYDGESFIFIKYPADFDIENFDFSRSAAGDFSLVNSLRWDQIKNQNFIHIKFPPHFDIKNADFRDKCLIQSDFSLVEELKWDQIKDSLIDGLKFPSNFDIENADFSGKNIRGCDFRLVRGLKWAQIKDAKDIKELKYPADFDIENADFSGKGIYGSDFSLIKQLSVKQIKNAIHINGIRYPVNFDIENPDFENIDISESDFSLVRGLRWIYIKNHCNISGIKYPQEFDIENASFTRKSINGSDFSLVKGLRWKQIKNAEWINSLKYPANFDIDNTDFNYNKRDISESDFSLIGGNVKDQLSFNSQASIKKELYNIAKRKEDVVSMRGKIKFYNSFNKFGFIIGDDNKEYYFNTKNIQTPLNISFCKEGTVEFVIKASNKGPIADKITYIRSQKEIEYELKLEEERKEEQEQKKRNLLIKELEKVADDIFLNFIIDNEISFHELQTRFSNLRTFRYQKYGSVENELMFNAKLHLEELLSKKELKRKLARIEKLTFEGCKKESCRFLEYYTYDKNSGGAFDRYDTSPIVLVTESRCGLGDSIKFQPGLKINCETYVKAEVYHYHNFSDYERLSYDELLEKLRIDDVTAKKICLKEWLVHKGYLAEWILSGELYEFFPGINFTKES